MIVALLAGCKGPARAPAQRKDVPTIPESCKGAEGERLLREGSEQERLECAWAFFRRGCALGSAESCEGQRRVERRLLEMAAGSPDR